MTRAKVSHSEVPEWASAVLREDWATCRDLFRDLRYFAHPETHIAKVRIAVLAARCGKTVRMVRLAMRQLEAVGLVRRAHSHCGRGHVQQYIVAWERAWGPPPADQPTADFQPALMVSVATQTPPELGGNGPVDNSELGGNDGQLGGNGFPPKSELGGNGFPPMEAPLYTKHLSKDIHTLGAYGQDRARGLANDDDDGAAVPPWCGECEGERVPERWRTGEQGQRFRCPACHPLQLAAAETQTPAAEQESISGTAAVALSGFSPDAPTAETPQPQQATAGPVRPSDGLTAPDLGDLARQTQELLEQALGGLSPEMLEFARTGRKAG